MTKRRLTQEGRTSIIDSKVNQMPLQSACLFHWLTVSSVRLRTLFDTIHNVVTTGVLIIDKNGISLDRYDNTKTMVVIAKLDHLGAGTYHCEKRLEVGLDIKHFYHTLNAVVQNDVLGLCITKRSWNRGDRTLDLFIMNETDMYSYAFNIRSLAISYEPVQLPERTEFTTQLSVTCTNFKRYLHDCAVHGEYVVLKRRYNKKTNLIETIMIPSGGAQNLTSLQLTLFSPVPDDFDEKKFNFSDSHAYSIASLQLFTKATTLCKNVVVLVTENFPLVVQYDVGDLGKLRFLLAPRVDANEDAWEDIEATPPINSLKRKAEMSVTELKAAASLAAHT